MGNGHTGQWRRVRALCIGGPAHGKYVEALANQAFLRVAMVPPVTASVVTYWTESGEPVPVAYAVYRRTVWRSLGLRMVIWITGAGPTDEELADVLLSPAAKAAGGRSLRQE